MPEEASELHRWQMIVLSNPEADLRPRNQLQCQFEWGLVDCMGLDGTVTQMMLAQSKQGRSSQDQNQFEKWAEWEKVDLEILPFLSCIQQSIREDILSALPYMSPSWISCHAHPENNQQKTENNQQKAQNALPPVYDIPLWKA